MSMLPWTKLPVQNMEHPTRLYWPSVSYCPSKRKIAIRHAEENFFLQKDNNLQQNREDLHGP